MPIYTPDRINLDNLKCDVILIDGTEYLCKDVCTSANDLVFSFWNTDDTMKVIPYSQIASIDMYEGED